MRDFEPLELNFYSMVATRKNKIEGKCQNLYISSVRDNELFWDEFVHTDLPGLKRSRLKKRLTF